MLTLIQQVGFTPAQWGMLLLSGFLIGAAKTGLSGISTVSIPLMALVFGGKLSVGVMLPMLIVADVFAVSYYRHHVQWRYVLRLMPWALVGIVLATLFGSHISDKGFKMLIGFFVLSGIVLMLLKDFTRFSDIIPKTWWFAALLGMVAGFSSMIGNAAGPLMAMYFLAMGLPKNHFIGTGAFFFFTTNLIKVPFHAFAWHTISATSLTANAMAIPFIIAGSVTGIYAVSLLNEKVYRYFVMASTTLSALFLF